ncbi:MAG TPA: serine O-acetyltransferase [Albitalea sp.]|nr:serine O-acetyltransferase [Albitalea sp.]HJW10924.1 serine O-acetyltransferase [Albitalea sp.]
MESLWNLIRLEASERALGEPELAAYLHDAILRWSDWDAALAHRLAQRLAGASPGVEALHAMIARAFAADAAIGIAAALDLRAVVERDPACHGLHVPFLFYKGFHALQIYRAAHWHWRSGMPTTAHLLQHRCNEALAIDIHPAARIGRSVMLDHGTGFVAGETAVIEDHVSLLHGVTLGGTGKRGGDRHPKVRCGASIGAGAKILGNIEIGAGAKIGAGSVVLEAVPSDRTAVGTRARVVDRRELIHP